MVYDYILRIHKIKKNYIGGRRPSKQNKVHFSDERLFTINNARFWFSFLAT